MSFTVRDAALNFNIVTISMWFRVPTASIEAAELKYADFDGGGGYWRGILPLLTWGEQSTAQRKQLVTINHGPPPENHDVPGGEIITFGIDDLDEIPQGCGYIGLRCDPDADGPVIETYIPTNNPASLINNVIAADDWIWIVDGTDGEGNPTHWHIQYLNGDFSEIDESYNDWFGSRSVGLYVTPDEPHHLVISWDLSGGSATNGGPEGGAPADECVTASSLMYMALDGVNITGEQLPSIWLGEAMGVNNHVSFVSCQDAGNGTTEFGPKTGSLTVGTIQTSPLSIPGPAFVDVVGDGGTVSDPPVLNIQMSEVQIFTGVLLNTSVESNVLAFRTGDGNAASPSLAAALMGKDPDVYFRTVNDWQTGNNRGTAGSFTPTGTIAEYILP